MGGWVLDDLCMYGRVQAREGTRAGSDDGANARTKRRNGSSNSQRAEHRRHIVRPCEHPVQPGAHGPAVAVRSLLSVQCNSKYGFVLHLSCCSCYSLMQGLLFPWMH